MRDTSPSNLQQEKNLNKNTNGTDFLLLQIKDFDNFVNRDTITVPGQGKDSVNNRSIMRLKDQEWREMR